MASNIASSMLWNNYCPGLRETGMVSSATGYLDFLSYMAASISSTMFANAVSDIGWGNLILIWFGLMLVGTVVSIPLKKR
jgi:sugar phosphate permease